MTIIDPLSELRLSKLHPDLAAKVRLIIEGLNPGGIIIRVTQGLRTYQEQDALYAQGRQSYLAVNALRKIALLEPIANAENHSVTNARGGESYHNYGLAVDLAPGLTPDSEHWAPDWRDRSASGILTAHYQAMVTLGANLGLVSGSCWHKCDDPHFQMAGTLPESKPGAEAESLLRKSGVEAVWGMAGLAV